MPTNTPSKQESIKACKEVEQSTIYGDEVKRVCKNTREALENDES